MSFIGTLYKGVAKRTSTFVLAIAVSAFVFERGFKWQYFITENYKCLMFRLCLDVT